MIIDNLKVEAENASLSPLPSSPVVVDKDVGKAIEEYPNMMSFEPGVYKLPGRTVPFYITPAIDHCGMCGKRPKSHWCKHLIAAGAREGIAYQGKIHTTSLSAAKDSQRGSKRKSGGKSPRPFDLKPFPGSKEVHIIDFELEDEVQTEGQGTDEGAKRKKRKGLNESDEKAVETALELFMKTKKRGVHKIGEVGERKSKVSERKGKVGEKNKAGEKKNKNGESKENAAENKEEVDQKGRNKKGALFSPPLPRVRRKRNGE